MRNEEEQSVSPRQTLDYFVLYNVFVTLEYLNMLQFSAGFNFLQVGFSSAILNYYDLGI